MTKFYFINIVKKYFFTIAFVSWMVFVTFSSLYSFSGIDTQSFIHIPHFDKVVHFIFYFVACILGVLFLRERTKGKMYFIKALVIICITTIVFGIIIEVLQYTITVERMGDLFDGLANSLGSLCGVLSMKLLFSGKRQLKWKY